MLKLISHLCIKFYWRMRLDDHTYIIDVLVNTNRKRELTDHKLWYIAQQIEVMHVIYDIYMHTLFGMWKDFTRINNKRPLYLQSSVEVYNSLKEFQDFVIENTKV